MPSANRQSSLDSMQYLDKSDTRLKLALQATNSGMWEWDLLTGQVVWSENFEQMFGLAPGTSTLTYRGLLKRICWEDRRLVMRSLVHAIQGITHYTIEFRIHAPDGSLRWLKSQGEVYGDENAHPIKMTGLCQDITRDKQQTRQVAHVQQGDETPEGILPKQLQFKNADLSHRGNGKVELSQLINFFTSECCGFDYLSTSSHTRTLTHSTEATSAGGETNGYRAFDNKSDPLHHKGRLGKQHSRDKPQSNGDNTAIATSRASVGCVSMPTGRKQALSCSWKSLVQYSSDLIVVASADGTILYNNPSIERILGYSPEELVGQQGFNYIAPQDVEIVKKALDELFVAERGATLALITFRALCKDGSWCVLEATATNLLADETVRGIAIAARDVTQRFRIHEALQQSEVRFRAIFENAVLGVALSDPSGKLLASNPALHRMFGYSEEELRERTVAHPEDVALESKLFRELVAGSLPSYQLEKRYFHKNGSLVWGRLSVSLVRDRTGNPLFTVSMVEDITAAKQTEAELLRISKAVENASDAIAIADVLPVGFRYINPAFCQMFGYKLKQLNKAGGFSALFADPKLMQEVLAIAIRGDSWQGEVEMLARNGSRKLIALRIDAIKDGTSEVVGTIAIYTDITERKQAEAALRRSYERAELLKQITSEIRSSLDLQHIFQTTVTYLGQVLRVNRCMIFLYEEVQQPKLSLVAEYLEPGYCSIREFEFCVEGNPHKEQVLSSDHAIATPNVYTEPLLEPTVHMYRAMNVKSMLAIRTSYQGEPNGLLGLHQCDTYRYWESSEIELLEAVAAQVGIALAQANLLEKEKRTATQLAQQNLALQLSEARANTKATQLEQALLELQRTQAQLVQTEKMSSLGQLVAGVAHEINNPVGFITVNIDYACDYIQDLIKIVNLYRQYYPQPAEEIQAELQEMDLDFLVNDLPKLLKSMEVGADRINQIVLSLRNFSRPDEAEMNAVDIHEGIDHTLMILRHRLKGKGKGEHPEIAIVKQYGTLPLVECYAGQLNQVFMNLISNAIDALESSTVKPEEMQKNCQACSGTEQQTNLPHTCGPKIEICTEVKDNRWVTISIKDNGPGMTEDVKQKLFDPFFTTKPMGKGTGLGLSISYQIIVEKHGGNLHCVSAPGQGAQFIIEIPLDIRDRKTAISPSPEP
jgi:two-component system NtrC family sensor kinase